MSNPLPILSNMPWNVTQSIINDVDYRTRFALRKCSRELRDINDNSVVVYPKLCILVRTTYVIQCFVSPTEEEDVMGKMINYSQRSKDSCYVGYVTRMRTSKTVNGQNYIERAVSDLATSLKNPRSSFEYVGIDHKQDRVHESLVPFLTCLKNMLEQLPHQLNIQKLDLRFPATQEHILHVLPYLKPGFLKHIIIDNMREVDQLVNTEQWRMAESVTLKNESNIRVQDLLHLRYFTIESYQLTPEEMPLIIQAFLTQTTTNHLHYSIGLPQNYNLTPIKTWLNRNETLITGGDPNRWRMKVQGTEFHVEIVLSMRRNRLYVHRLLSSILEN